MGPGDVISIPTRMFRGFENIGTETGFLFAVLGGDNPGKVTWAPSVFDLAARHGLVLLEGGKLVDTIAGEQVPAGATLQRAPDAAEIARLATPPAEKLAGCVRTPAQFAPNPASPLAGPGVTESAIITPTATADGFPPGPIAGWWAHGFNLRHLAMESGARVAAHLRDEPEVIFVHAGVLAVTLPDGDVLMGPGDTLTVPVGAARSFRATSSAAVAAYVVRGGDSPAAPRFI